VCTENLVCVDDLTESPKLAEWSGASLPGQVVLVLQGGGALGSYQAGVYQAAAGVRCTLLQNSLSRGRRSCRVFPAIRLALMAPMDVPRPCQQR
jgi:hypothetical protein